MSVNINLLPWRQAHRKQMMIQFFFMTAVALFFVVVVLSGVHVFYQTKIDNKIAENDLIKNEIVQMDAKISAIKNLQKEKMRLMNRIKAIQILQKNRNKTVKLLEDLVRSIPVGLHLEQVSRKEDVIMIDGGAESNSDVAQLMRNLSKTTELVAPILSVIQSDNKDKTRMIQFNLQAKQPDLLLVHEEVKK